MPCAKNCVSDARSGSCGVEKGHLEVLKEYEHVWVKKSLNNSIMEVGMVSWLRKC